VRRQQATSNRQQGQSRKSFARLVDDLYAERRVVEAALVRLADAGWEVESPAEGWTLRDCVAHLAETDDNATREIGGDAPPPVAGKREGVLTASQRQARSISPAEVLSWYREANDRLVATLRRHKGDDRLPWLGRPMSARSFVSARLMEHWSHGLDILEAAGVAPVDTERLRHVAHLGYLTRDFAYRNRGLEPPATPLYVELTSPGGETWTWGPPDAPDRIYGPAGDFCRVVTQRIHPADTSLRAEGPGAVEFLSLAQAFAGPPGAGRPPRSSKP
jgi:uncharacterized protein (TIGR03084 family)